MLSQTSEKHILNADIVRVTALFAVVGIHLLNPIYARPDFFGGKFWWLCFILDCLFRASVPLFVMLSGYLLLGKSTTVQENLRRTWKRLGIPLLSFYLIIFFYKWFVAGTRQKPYSLLELFHGLSKNSSSYLYFLVILVFLYLLIPLFRLVFEQRDKALQKYLIGFFFVNALLATVARYTTLRVGDVFNTYTMWVLWIGYFLLGYWIRLNQEWLKTRVKPAVVCALGGILLTIGMGHWSWGQHWRGNDALYIAGVTYPEEYLSVGVVMTAVAVFILLLTAKLPQKFTENASLTSKLVWLSQISFGVYLVHPLVIDVLNNFFGITADNPAMPNLPTYVVINAALTLLISISLSAVLNNTPLLKKIVGR